MIKSITKSQHIIVTNAVSWLNGTSSIPSMPALTGKSWQELRNLFFTQVQWYNNWAIGFTLSDGKTCKAGNYGFTNSYFFNQTKKITRIECIIYNQEDYILQINFDHHGERLVQIGRNDDWVEICGGGRREVFEIAEDEQFIGCELDNNG